MRFRNDRGQSRFFRISGWPVHEADGLFLGYRGIGVDISDEVAQEAERRKAEDRLSAAIENLSDDFILFDEYDRLVRCNERYRRSMLAIADRLVPGIGFEDYARLIAPYITAAQGRTEEWVEERKVRHRLGLSCELTSPEGRSYLVKDMHLKDGGIVVTRTDISELKRREQALRESEARLRAIFTQAAIGVAMIHPGGRIAEANPALAAMLGYNPEDLAGRPFVDLTHPANREEDCRQARRLITGEIEHYQLEGRFQRQDGTLMWGRQTVSLVRSAGPAGERFAIVMIEDIDDHKRAEEDLSIFRAVVEQSHEAVAIMEPDGRPFFANHAFERLFGRSPRIRPDFTFGDCYAGDSREVFESQVMSALRRCEGWEGVLAGQDGNGRCFPVWQRAGVVCNAHGRAQLFFSFLHDHTPQRQVEDELHKAKEAAEHANIAKTRFLAAASHDLRQPLQALSLFVAVLSAKEHSRETAALVSKVHDSVNALDSLLSSLLDVSKLEAGLVVPTVEN
ncbi:MAG: PAS domain S-box protein, partial [Rhodospirillales bacterium]|nr:PAS domain S-box protein [Rhodospirillales bacterium]